MSLKFHNTMSSAAVPPQFAGKAGSRWIISIRNYREDEDEELKSFVRSYCRFGITSYELKTVVGSGGRYSLMRCYAELANEVAFSTIKRAVPGRAHLEVARRSRRFFLAYCDNIDTFEIQHCKHAMEL